MKRIDQLKNRIARLFSTLKEHHSISFIVICSPAFLALALLFTSVHSASTSAVSIPVVESKHPYSNGLDDSWTITNLDKNAVASRLYFSRIELEEGVDHLVISDAYDNEFQRFTAVYTNGVWTDPVIGNDIKVRLVTDNSVKEWGFEANKLETVSYPSLAYSAHPYPNNSSEEWVLTNNDSGAEASHIHFSGIELEENVDRILIMDSFDTIYQYITQTNTTGLWTVGVPGNDVKVRLESDNSVVRWGFNIDQIGSSSAADPALAPGTGAALAESEHPYSDNLNQTWTIVNPNLDAISTKVHFDKIDLNNVSDVIYIRDNDDKLFQEINYNATDLWTEYVSGRIIKVQFDTNSYGTDWGFRVDDIFPHAEIVPKSVGFKGVYVQVFAPAIIFLDDQEILHTDRVGEFKIPISGVGEHIIRLDYQSLDMEQIIKVTLGDDSEIISHFSNTNLESANITSIHLEVFAPAYIYMDDKEIKRTNQPGEFKIILPGIGDYTIRIEYYQILNINERIQVNVDTDGNLTIGPKVDKSTMIYLPMIEG